MDNLIETRGEGLALLLRGLRKAFANVQAVDGSTCRLLQANASACSGQTAQARPRPLRFAKG